MHFAAAQRELAHRERRRLRVALDASRSAGEQDCTAPFRQHAASRLLRNEERAVRRDAHRLLHGRRVDIDERCAHTPAGVVDHHLRRRAEVPSRRIEKRGHRRGIGRVTSQHAGTGLARDGLQLFALSRRDDHLQAAVASKDACQAGAQTWPGTDDQGS